MKTHYDAIVIGAGSVGVPTTYFLAMRGYHVLCLDSYSSSGQGQNKAAIGGTRATHSDPAKIRICQKSLEIFSTWEEYHGQSIGWKKGGYCFPVYRAKEEKLLKSILPIQKKFDLNIDWVGPDKIKEIIPGINPNGLIGGTFSQDDGQVCPLLAIEAMDKAAREAGAEFKFKNEVTDLIINNNTIEGVKTRNGTYTADVIVNAAGAHAREIGYMAGLDIPVFPESHEAGISAPVRPFLGPLVVDLRPGREGKTANFYFGQNHENAVIFCYTPKVPFAGLDRGATSEFMPIIANRLVELIPRLKNLMVRRLWRGLYPMTPDGVAIVGKAPGISGLYLAVGMCGQGLMMGPGVGRELAALIDKGKPEMDKKVFDSLSPERDFYAGKVEALK
ncbi:MAG: FAD-binding oxidoreductase [Thermoplasmata archaeon]|nr:FAD-binding oxidoreductase [Thermoplasmata archaeon]